MTAFRSKSIIYLHQGTKFTSMAHRSQNPKRYFVNHLPDYCGESVKLPVEQLKEQCMNYAQQIFQRQGKGFKDADGGLYVGIPGIAYMCLHLSQHPRFAENKQELLVRGEDYLKCAIPYVEQMSMRDKAMEVAFLLGGSGTYAVGAVLMDSIGKKDQCDQFLHRYASLADVCIPRNFLSCGSDELFVGRAGYLCGVLFLKKTLGIDVVSLSKISQLCQAIVESGKEYSRKVNSPCPLMYSYYGTEYLGAAHGLCSILQMLLSFPFFLDENPQAELLIKGAVDFLLSLQTASGNFPCAMDEVAQQRPEQEELVHWCHGAPGVVYLMSKAYLRWKDSRYLQSCLSCGEVVWKKGLLKKGPGICHGVAGSGYVFLLLFMLTREELHLHRALQFALFLSSEEFKRARVPDSPYSLYEGLAGTVCFLADLMQPEKATFPFFSIL